MGTLRSALDELRTADLRRASEDELEDDLAELERTSRAIEAERVRRVAEIERRGAFRRDGHLSTSSWLAARFRVAWSVASHQVRWARALEDMPETREGLASGELSCSAVGLLVAAREAACEAFSSSEPTLVQAARSLPIRELQYALAYWRQAADPAANECEAELRFEQRRLHVSPTLRGMVRVDGDLDQETGQTFIAALRSVMDAEARAGHRSDDRSQPQRRADALGEICRRWLDSSDRPAVAGERPHVTVTVDMDTLRGGPGGRSELDEAGPITPETARRWVCDASVSRVVTQGRSEPLDVGRRTPVVPAALRRALIVRDAGCRFPGCDRPHPWCDAHHIHHWADGGDTALPNLVLLCRRHHRLTHQGFQVSVVDGAPRFERPDGSPLDDRGPL